MENFTGNMPFWSFFYELEKQLSYERWTDKYKLFLGQLYSNEYLESYHDSGRLLQLCKVLYLQDIKDEARFEQLFAQAWEREQLNLEKFFQNLIHEHLEEKERSGGAAPTEQAAHRPDDKSAGMEPRSEKSQSPKTQSVTKSKNTKKYFYNPPTLTVPAFSGQQEDENKVSIQRFFNYQDEYLPLQRREMNKAWQYLRRSEKGAPTNVVDIKATVSKLAREVIFTEPVFVSGKQNRQDAVILLVDCNGSMVPFHELSRRLVTSAREFGGHRNARSFYFQNYPQGYLYENENLTKPIPIAEAFAESNSQLTTLIIVSDAGFARNYGSDERYQVRLNGLAAFFEQIKNCFAHVLWLNPMPKNRWYMPLAWEIENRVLLHQPGGREAQQIRITMESLSGNGMNIFQNAIKNMIRKKQ